MHPNPINPEYDVKATCDANRRAKPDQWIGSEAIKSKINYVFPASQFAGGALNPGHA
jgi:hypothetical protein